jgi:hypothetical protein
MEDDVYTHPRQTTQNTRSRKLREKGTAATITLLIHDGCIGSL